MKFSSFFTNILHEVPKPQIPQDWRVLMTGVTSIHGWPIFQRLSELLPAEQLYAVRPVQMAIPEGENVYSVCINDYAALSKIKDTFRPTHVIHGMGVCDLDACEANPQWARNINVKGTTNIIDLFGLSAYIMYLGSDLVFSGNRPPANGYLEKHATDPVSVVGRTFLEAEKEIQKAEKHCIVRLALPTGDSVTGTKGAVDFIEKRFKRKLPMTLFYDELRSCIDCQELAEVVMHLFCKETPGLFHLGGEEQVSLYDLGEKILKKGNYSEHLLQRLSRHQEKNGPPRIGNVGLDSTKISNWFAKEFQVVGCRS
ncbi:sugar nucleotide-binding protein [bacterium]|nr:sugar nucleotide-binding protein [bacterium]